MIIRHDHDLVVAGVAQAALATFFKSFNLDDHGVSQIEAAGGGEPPELLELLGFSCENDILQMVRWYPHLWMP